MAQSTFAGKKGALSEVLKMGKKLKIHHIYEDEKGIEYLKVAETDDCIFCSAV